ncbi:MAG: hypothetical protein QNL33_09675 [Akkermansiaceae bacterium]
MKTFKIFRFNSLSISQLGEKLTRMVTQLDGFLGSETGGVLGKAIDQLLLMQDETGQVNSIKFLLGIDLGGELNRAVISSLARFDPFPVWESVMKSGIEVEDDIQRSILREMITSDAANALSSLSRYPSGSALLYTMAAKEWAQADMKAAKAWVEAHDSILTKEQQDRYYSGLIGVHANRKDFSSARAMLDSISDSELKSKAEGEVWQTEKKVLQGAVASDPEGTISLIISGESSFADYWLEESVATWLKKDAGAVNEWYEENWESMSAEKTQYVAAAFAQEALTLGDLATAREWAERIQNPTTRGRIEEVIQKAQK